jgi:hypothetical protein
VLLFFRVVRTASYIPCLGVAADGSIYLPSTNASPSSCFHPCPPFFNIMDRNNAWILGVVSGFRCRYFSSYLAWLPNNSHGTVADSLFRLHICSVVADGYDPNGGVGSFIRATCPLSALDVLSDLVSISTGSPSDIVVIKPLLQDAYTDSS